MRTIGVLLLLAVAVLAADPFRPPRQRDINIDVRRDSVRARLTRNDNGAMNRVDFEFRLDGFPRFRTMFFRRDADSASSFKFRTGLLRVVEFNDTGANGYDGETPLSQIVLRGLGNRWSPIQDETTRVNNVTLRRYSSKLSNNVGDVTIRIYLAGDVVNFNNTNVAPNKFKFDVEIANYQFTSATSKLAVVSVIQSVDAPQRKDDVNPATSGDVAVGTAGRFGWIKSASAVKTGRADQTVNVVSSNLLAPTAADNVVAGDDDDDNRESAKIIYFTFDPTAHDGSKLVWDPEVVLDADSLSTSAGVATQPTIVAVILAVILALVRLF